MSGECCHVECAADVGASGLDGTGSTTGSAVAVEGGHTDECGDLLAVELAEFGQFGDECACGGGSDARRGLQEFGLGPPLFVVVDEFVDLAFDALDFVGEEAFGLVETASYGFE